MNALLLIASVNASTAPADASVHAAGMTIDPLQAANAAVWQLMPPDAAAPDAASPPAPLAASSAPHDAAVRLDDAFAAPWPLAFGVTLLGLALIALRGPLARVRSPAWRVGLRWGLSLVVVACGCLLVLADLIWTVTVDATWLWIGALAIAWLALGLGAVSVARTGRLGLVRREPSESFVL